jgi:hypothetical protein
MIRRIISRLTMQKTTKSGFIDRVTGEYVAYWVDKFGDEYIAVNKFSMRCLTKKNEKIK